MSTGNQQPVNAFGLKELLAIVKKRIILVLGIFIITSGLVFTVQMLSTDYYESKFAFKPFYITPEQTMIVLEHLNTLIEHKQVDELAKLMEVDTVVLANLKPFDFKISDGKIIEVEITVFSADAIMDCQRGVMHYLNNNDFIVKTRKAESDRLSALLERIRGEIKALEETKANINVLLKKGKIDLNYPNDLHVQLVALEREQGNTQKNLHMVNEFQMLKSPIIPKDPSGPQTRRVVIISALSFVFAVFFAVFLENLA